MTQFSEGGVTEGLRSVRPRALLAYGTMVMAAVGLFLVIDACGAWIAPSRSTATAARVPALVAGKPDVLVHVLVALTTVLITGRVLGWLFSYVGQPAVMGEVVGGILLGPSLLGRAWPEVASFVLPPSISPTLGAIAQLGVILYMFIVGLELDLGTLRERAHSSVAISHASITVPFLLGSAMALILYPKLSGGGVPFTSFALFLGVATSITAFPVLARILTDRGLQRSHLGVIALSCAAADDVTAWCLLAFVICVVQADVARAFVVLGLTASFIVFMLFLVRRVVIRHLARDGKDYLTPATTALVFAALLLSALATEWIGIHAIFGAFLFGAIIPHDSVIARTTAYKLEDVVSVLLLPAFFAFTGMRTQIGLVSGLEQWLVCGLIILVATVGKFGGTVIAARFVGHGWRESAGLGVLMNTRGLMELIVLNIGLDLKVISPTLFAMMVLMALITTLATTPLLHVMGLATPPRDTVGLEKWGVAHK